MPDYDDQPSFRDFREAEIPRWIRIPIGIILGLFTLFCALATSVLIFPGKYVPSPIFARAVGAILLLGASGYWRNVFAWSPAAKGRAGY